MHRRPFIRRAAGRLLAFSLAGACSMLAGTQATA